MKTILLLAFFFFSTSIFAQFETKFKEMSDVQNPNFNDYDDLVFESTTYIFNHAIDEKSDELKYAKKIAQFWMDRDTGFGMPIFGTFYMSLEKQSNQRFYYILAMMHYNLIQKIENNRLVLFTKVEGVKFSELPEVKEVQLEGAKILLNYSQQEKNNLKLSSNCEKYIVANREGNLEKIFFQ
jgi:flavodoxin